MSTPLLSPIALLKANAAVHEANTSKQCIGAFSPGVLRARRSHVFREPGYHVWCGSVIEWDGAWWLFYSRWEEKLGFDAWATHSEVAVARGNSAHGPFETCGRVVLPASAGGWDADTAHNPTVFAANGRLHLAYTGTFGPYGAIGRTGGGVPMDELWWEHRNNQRIGIAVSAHPLDLWKTLPLPAIDTAPDGWDSLCVSNPSVTMGPDGVFLMIYKGVTDGPRPFGSRVLHGVARCAKATGPYRRVQGVHPFQVEGAAFAAEDPFIWCDRAAGCFRAVVKDMSGDLTGGGRCLAFFESTDGELWLPSAERPVSGSALRWEDGTVEPFSRIERPQVTVDASGEAVALRVACLPEEDGAASFSLSVPLPAGYFHGRGGGIFA
jgi:hypothetical protein